MSDPFPEVQLAKKRGEVVNSAMDYSKTQPSVYDGSTRFQFTAPSPYTVSTSSGSSGGGALFVLIVSFFIWGTAPVLAVLLLVCGVAFFIFYARETLSGSPHKRIIRWVICLGGVIGFLSSFSWFVFVQNEELGTGLFLGLFGALLV